MPSGDWEILQLVSTSDFLKICLGLCISSDLSMAQDLSSEKETILVGHRLGYIRKRRRWQGSQGGGCFDGEGKGSPLLLCVTEHQER